jgi:hypothetical protein
MPSLKQTAASNEIQIRKQPWRNEESVDIWGWCHTPFQSYVTQLLEVSDNIRVLFHFTVRETHKSVHEIRDRKKKTQTLRGKKNEKIISSNCLPHRTRASFFMNKQEAAQIQLICMFSRFWRMSERAHRNEQCPSLHDRWCFRYDEQCPSLHAERLIIVTII